MTQRDIPQLNASIGTLKALAHPDRLNILGNLRVSGPSTASLLARRFGLNSGATSYHLRQLEKYGLVEEAPELGNRRERWWHALHETTFYETADLDGDALEAGIAFNQAVLATHMHMMQRAQEAYRGLDTAWRKASTNSDVIIPLNAAAAETLTNRIMGLLMEAKAASPPTGVPLPADTRPVAYVLYAFPHPDAEAEVGADEP
ncbi:winged helix-turn-helix domain-containing protein [Rhizobium wuzhouense]|uniref:ArsR family transcriptional regulator n=1 Tax=Rhizobium wuzhouense TaxID=1986026 RepID=A0ABX5NV16_9HYPH|nr:helix-turn-helix domain-containing protein [Rhizobium wuzhouense]PYB77010.1 ArsR family transcriptional regulator [Rhizobium wuzhouense]